MLSQKKEDDNDNVIEGKPMPNTVQHTLEVFPLSTEIPKSARQKRSWHEYFNFETPLVLKDDTKKIVENVLYPSEEDLLSDTFNRLNGQDVNGMNIVCTSVGTTKRAKTEKGSNSLLNIFSTRINILLQDNLNTLSSSSATSKTTKKRIPLSQRRINRFLENKTTEVVTTTTTTTSPEYFYLPPNEFGVKLCNPYQLYQHQKDAIKWMIDRIDGKIINPNFTPDINGCMLAMSMGLGKTVCVGSMIMRTLSEQRKNDSCSLYVCPKNLLGTVRHEMAKFFGDQLRVLVYHKEFIKDLYGEFYQADIKKYDLLITNYETIHTRWENALNYCHPQEKKKNAIDRLGSQNTDKKKKNEKAAYDFSHFDWYNIILDECQYIRNDDTKKFKSVIDLKSKRRICITGTPIYNSMKDIFNELTFCGLVKPTNKQCTKKTFDELKLRDMVRFVEAKDVEVKLPPKTIHKVYFELSKTEKFLHKFFTSKAKQIFTDLKTTTLVGQKKTKLSKELQNSMLRCIQICSAPYLITPQSKNEKKEEKDMETELDEELPPAYDLMVELQYGVENSDQKLHEWIMDKTKEAGIKSSKMLAFRNLYENTLKQKKTKIVVYANYTSCLQLAIESMMDYDPDFASKHVYVHGSVVADKREAMFTQFRTNPKIEFLFMTLQLAVGLNLVEACTVVTLQPWYSYAPHFQAESRVHRIGQINPVNIYYLLAKDSVEERVHSIAMSKKEIAEDICAARKDNYATQKEYQDILFGMDEN